MRGLKRSITNYSINLNSRTLTGAWIETWETQINKYQSNVAPSRVRGLKQIKIAYSFQGVRRTLTGAWIETSFLSKMLLVFKVAPSRVRGLKHNNQLVQVLTFGSHPHGCVD